MEKTTTAIQSAGRHKTHHKGIDQLMLGDITMKIDETIRRYGFSVPGILDLKNPI